MNQQGSRTVVAARWRNHVSEPTPGLDRGDSARREPLLESGSQKVQREREKY